MLAYRKTDFENLRRGKAIRQWEADGLVAGDKAKSLAASFPSPFYSPSIFVRIGLFLFGALGGQAALGMLALISRADSRKGMGVLLLLFAAGLFFCLETLIRKPKPFFRAGLEEAMLYGAMGTWVAGFFMIADLSQKPHVALMLLITAALAYAALRYADSLLAAMAFGLGLYVVFDMVSSWGGFARMLLPFLVMLMAASTVWATGLALRHPHLRDWDHLWKALRCMALFTCYAGGNYLAVREMSRLLFGMPLGQGEDIPLALAFYAFTFGLPLFYIAWGMAKRDKLFLRVGLVIAGLAVLTYKYYHSTLPIEIGLVIAGMILLGIAVFALKFFLPSRLGMTSEEDGEFSREQILPWENLAALAPIPGKDGAPQNQDGGSFEGEGGKFGGGGSQGKF